MLRAGRSISDVRGGAHFMYFCSGRPRRNLMFWKGPFCLGGLVFEGFLFPKGLSILGGVLGGVHALLADSLILYFFRGHW